MENALLAKYKKEESTFALGRRGMNSKYPNEFEVYMLALELVDGDTGNTLEYFAFPVMPFQITKTEPTRTTVKKSASGTTVIQNDSFVPQEIAIKGDFGKGFKLMADAGEPSLEGVAFKGYLSNTDKKNATFDPNVKTGFGATKILQNIISSATKLNVSGKPNKLYFYNMALSESYLIIVPQTGLVLSQNYSKNMIWEYSLTLTILAPLEKVVTKVRSSSVQKLLDTPNLDTQTKVIASKTSWVLKNSAKVIDFMHKVSKFDVSKYLTDFVAFVNNDMSNIVAYYKAGVDIVDSSFNAFDSLYRQAGEVDQMINDYRNIFVNCEIWELVDHFSEIQRKLDTIYNMSRWSRSSRLTRFDGKIKVDYIQKQNESMENISRKAGSINYDDTWVNLAITNDINEEKYTSQGGTMMSVSFQNNTSFSVKNIVDNLIGENVYGKDIVKKMEIVDGDYAVLTGFPALVQTFDTILNTVKGSIPEFPEDGTPDGVGTNMNTIGFPLLFRCMLQMFQKDDRFTEVDLLDLYHDQDNVFMKLQAKTKIGRNLITNVLI